MATVNESFMTHAGQESLFNKLPAQAHFTSDDYYTPKWVFDALKLEFDLDVCAPPQATNVPAKSRYTMENDGLSSPWFGLVYMNPPFSNTSKWAERFIAHNNGIALVPLSKSAWFDKLWSTAQGIIVLPSRFEFMTPLGKPRGIFIPVCLMALGTKAYKALAQSNLGRMR